MLYYFHLLQQTHKTQITTGSISSAAVENIKQIIEAEHEQCVVTSPMDKLESFFINTVTAAQQQGLATSGAVSGAAAGISDFLTGASDEENILDKLVSKPISQQPAKDLPTTEQPKPLETAKTAPDEQLLSDLTAARAEPTTTTEPVIPQAPDKQEQNKKDISSYSL